MARTLPSGYVDYAQQRKDVGELAFVERALNYVEREVYYAEFPPLEGLKYVPVDTSDPEGAKTTSYRQITRTGIAKMITERGDDAPATKLFVREFHHSYYRLGAWYELTLDDILAAQLAVQNGSNINLEMEQALGAREAINRGLDVVAAIGSTTSATIPGLSIGIGYDVGLLGLLNQPNATLYSVAHGSQLSTLWSAKTPDEMIADLAGIYAAMVASTYKVFKPDTILLPIQQFEAAKLRRMGDASDETVISFYKKINPAVTVDSWQYCQGAGVGGLDRMVAYINDKRRIRLKISQMFRQMPPEWRNLTFSVLCTAKTAGIVCPYPLAVSYGDGI